MIKQAIAIININVRSFPQRAGTGWVVIIGIAVTVAVMVSVLAMAKGFSQTLIGTARNDRAIVLRSGSEGELTSTLSRDDYQTVMDAPGIRKDTMGKPIVSAEAVTIVSLPQKSTNTLANIALRGVSQDSMTLRPEIHMISGRMFRPALRELIVGKAATKQFKGLEIGNHITFRDAEWTVVGIFESGGDAHESELQGNVETVMSAFRRNLFQSITVQLESAASFDRFKAALTTNPTLKVSVERETEYFSKQSQQLAALLNVLAYFVGSIMAIGASFGALNAMYSAVSLRTLEIATLRAIGFNSFPVVISVLFESLILAMLGSVLGSAAVWIMFNGNTVSTLGATFSQIVFRLTVTSSLLVSGMFAACTIGLIGGLFPAIRAARLPIAAALRTT